MDDFLPLCFIIVSEMQALLILWIVAVILFNSIYAARVVYDLNITYVNDVNPDGLYSRQVVGINNQWP